VVFVLLFFIFGFFSSLCVMLFFQAGSTLKSA